MTPEQEHATDPRNGDLQPLDPADEIGLRAFRERAERQNGPVSLERRRERFDEMVASVPLPTGMVVEPGELSGVPGSWCRPTDARPGTALLYLHGGGYMQGSAASFRGLAGQIAHRAGADAFVPDYRLAPENAYPAAVDDCFEAYRGLSGTGVSRIALAGDSAGGGMALAIASRLTAAEGLVRPCAVAVMSPVTDLAMTGPSIEDRAEADPTLSPDAMKGIAEQYLQGQDDRAPMASPLYGGVFDLPPLRIDVGTDEILLDDSRRFADRARAEGVEVRLDVWAGMPHVFQLQLGRLRAAERSLDLIGAFLRRRLDAVD